VLQAGNRFDYRRLSSRTGWPPSIGRRRPVVGLGSVCRRLTVTPCPGQIANSATLGCAFGAKTWVCGGAVTSSLAPTVWLGVPSASGESNDLAVALAWRSAFGDLDAQPDRLPFTAGLKLAGGRVAAAGGEVVVLISAFA
jgi:hypothetical protein